MSKKCKRQGPSNRESKQGMVRFEAGGMVEKRVRPAERRGKSEERDGQKTGGMVKNRVRP